MVKGLEIYGSYFLTLKKLVIFQSNDYKSITYIFKGLEIYG